ncbi:MAG: FAD-linked oxidase C-terminal domain-containing protein [Gammaproteobacteria bacterium]|nr:FAD-linked oxidase C-terminal domain-containing protein [Gammaproteobacteria bacterium]
MQTRPLSHSLKKAFARIVGKDSLLTDPADCLPYGYDNSRLQAMPAAVLFATTHSQVEAIVQLCHAQRITLIPRGTGTGTTGATVPTEGGIVLSLERMRRILEIDPDNRLARVEPGVTNQNLQDALAKQGFFWPPDPTSASICTIGGNLAYNSAGPLAVKYGTPRENTLGLKAVIGTGETIRTGVNTTKGVVGYDLTRLLIGSEGTLGVITEATLKLTPLPVGKRTLQISYQDIHAAARAVSAIMAQPVTPCALEFIDGPALEMVSDYADLELDAAVGAILMVEVDGTERNIGDEVSAVTAAAEVPGLLELKVADSPETIQYLWKIRKALSPALRNVAPRKINEDVVVPVSRIPQLIEGLQRLAAETGIKIINFGHAGNGNIHVNLLLNPDDPAQMKAGETCLNQLFDLVLQLGGTISGEHGIGLVKRAFVSREIDPVTLNLMRNLKLQFDPHQILNPGKVFPDR